MKRQTLHTAGIILAILLVIFLAIAGLYAKYVTSLNSYGQVTFSADLAESMELYEHKAVRQTDGTYELDLSEKAENNDYILMPGVDVPKDPQIDIVRKSGVNAYLYIEVVKNPEEFPAGVDCSLDRHWHPLAEANGIHGGTVYVYCDDGGVPFVLREDFGSRKVPILQDSMVKVSENYDVSSATSTKITFYAYMAQITNSKAAQEKTTEVIAAEVFNESFTL